jgi:hypothetical protein
MVDMEVIVRRQDQTHCASITCMIRHYVARRAKVIFDHPHNAASRARSLSAVAAVLGRFCSELAALGVGHGGVVLMVLQGGGPELLQP